jgi:hypothetical protein
MSLNRLHAGGSGYLDPNNLGLSVCLDSLFDDTAPERTLEHLNLVALTSVGHPDARHQAFLSSTKPDQQGRVIASFSVFAHETRHFHDLLLTCYGSFLLRQALQLNMAYFNMLRDDIVYLCDAIYLPLNEWVNNRELLRRFHPQLSPPTENIVRYVRESEQHEALLAKFEQGTSKRSPVTASCLLEASAIIAQEEYVRSNFGVESVRPFWSIFQGEAQRHYFGALDTLQTVLKREVPLDMQAFIIFAALCGDYRGKSGISGSTPPDAFVLILSELTSKKIDLFSPPDVSAAVNECFERWGWGSPFAAIKRAHRENRELLDVYRRTYEGEELHKSVEACLAAFENYCDVQDAYLQWFSDGHKGYFDLRQYSRDLFSLPLPPLYFECVRGLPYTDVLMTAFEMESGQSVRVNELPVELAGQLTDYHDRDGFLNLWHSISFRGSEAAEGFSPKVNIGAWRETCHWTTHSRFLLESNRASIPPYAVDDQLMGLSACGVTVITAEGVQQTQSKARPGSVTAELAHGASTLDDAKKGQFQVDSERSLEIKLRGDGAIGIEVPIRLKQEL